MKKLSLYATACTCFILQLQHFSAAQSSSNTPPLGASTIAEAERLDHTPEGITYKKAFFAVVRPRFEKARDESVVRFKPTPPLEIDITFVVSARGQITDTLAGGTLTLAQFVARKLIGLRVPKPPFDHYPIQIRTLMRAR